MTTIWTARPHNMVTDFVELQTDGTIIGEYSFRIIVGNFQMYEVFVAFFIVVTIFIGLCLFVGRLAIIIVFW